MKPFVLAVGLLLSLSSVGCRHATDADGQCSLISCQNGGVCKDGTCLCDASFYGDRCQYRTNGNDGGTSDPHRYGTVVGRAYPPSGVGSIRLTGKDSTYNAGVNEAGNFLFANFVAPGSYVVEVVPKPGYTAAPAKVLAVQADSTSQLGLLLVAPGTPQPGRITLTVDGVVHTIVPAYTGATYSDNVLFLDGAEGSDTNYYVFNLRVPNVTAPGSYALVGSGAFFNLYGHQGGRPSGFWTAYHNGSSVLTVTALDPVARTLSGTFAGQLGPVSPNSSEKNITGRFDGVHY